MHSGGIYQIINALITIINPFFGVGVVFQIKGHTCMDKNAEEL